MLTKASDADAAGALERLRRETLALIAAAICALGFFGWLAWTENQARAELAARIDRAASLVADMTYIRAAQNAAPPRPSAATVSTTGDLVQKVAHAMKQTGIAPEALLSTQPQPGKAIAGTDLIEHHCRLSFSELPLEPLVRFAERLQAEAGGCRITGWTLRAGESPRWVAELTVCVRQMQK